MVRMRVVLRLCLRASAPPAAASTTSVRTPAFGLPRRARLPPLGIATSTRAVGRAAGTTPSRRAASPSAASRTDAFRHCESLSSRHCEFLPSRHCEERSDEAISPIALPLHCEPKGWQVCWREAISPLHIPVGVRCSGGIASPDCYQARNDAMGLFARNCVTKHC